MPTRRTFLRQAGAATALGVLAPTRTFARRAAPAIERITVLRVPGSFYRPIAMNAYDDAPKGKAGAIRLTRLVLADGTTGVGVEGYDRIDEETEAGLKERIIGADPSDMYEWDGGRIQGFAPEYENFFQDVRYAWLETPLLDALGKLRGEPVHAFFGPSVRRGVDAYDGTLYFKDVETDQDAGVIGELASRIKADGYKAIKMKVGRALKWMKGEPGLERDIEAVAAAREAIGSNLNLMADANNGYEGHFDWALRLLEETQPQELYWMEEIMPEERERYRRLRKAMYERGVTTRLAEGENAMFGSGPVQEVDDFQPWLKAGLFDVIQPDMRTVGFSNVLRQARQAARHNKTLVPHNWQSEMGKLMGIHAAKVQENIRFVEDDRWSNYALDASDYRFRNGQWIAPDAPGWGVRLSEHYDRFVREGTERVIS
jgi:L-alanine-DL-glutamate epimerase-like enolase superfamily enzyme